MSCWARRLRRIAYAFGFTGLVMMLLARGSDDPAFRMEWSRRAMLCIGVMMATFASYYVLAMLRMYRR